MPEYEAWKESLGGKASCWRVKYYKGLGTSTNEDAQEYIENLDRHRKEFCWKDEQDGDDIELAFSTKRISDRKEWLNNFEPGTYLDNSQSRINFTDFINKEMILFSIADLQRSIPSMVDGLKPGQRKILFCSFKRNFTKEAKVAQFSGYVSEHSAYHHGEESLASTIIGMAQNFVGSNNINLLFPAGQFSTRNAGGKDAANAKYIFTKLAHITRSIFPKDDDTLLDYLNEYGQKIQPTWYMPILPMVLVNGSEGIGTGWSSFVPNYNPRDIIANLRWLLNGERIEPMHPWYRGFKGSIKKIQQNEVGVKYTTNGIIEVVDNTTLRITELPIRCWTEDYKKRLGSLKDDENLIKKYTQQGDANDVYFEITLNEERMNEAKEEGLVNKFKLTTVVGTTNMHLFDSNGKIRKYDTPEQILEEFILRSAFYESRKRVMEKKLAQEVTKLQNKIRFIQLVNDGKIEVRGKKKVDLCKDLQELGFDVGAIEDEEDDEESQESPANKIGSEYDYLLSMSFGTMSMEKDDLITHLIECRAALEEMRRAEPKSLWLRDLDLLEQELDLLDRMDAKDDEKRRKHRD